MVYIARLKHQKGTLSRVDVRAMKQEILYRTDKWNLGFDVAESPWFVAKVLSLEKNDGEMARHGSRLSWKSKIVKNEGKF
jgi:hypothetical protein